MHKERPVQVFLTDVRGDKACRIFPWKEILILYKHRPVFFSSKKWGLPADGFPLRLQVWTCTCRKGSIWGSAQPLYGSTFFSDQKVDLKGFLLLGHSFALWVRGHFALIKTTKKRVLISAKCSFTHRAKECPKLRKPLRSTFWSKKKLWGRCPYLWKFFVFPSRETRPEQLFPWKEVLVLYKQRPVQVLLTDVREIKACTIFEFRGTTPKKLI